MKLVIGSESDAWAALKKAVDGEYPSDVQVEFASWPTFKLDFKGKDWNSTVPTRVMTPLLDVQRDINRAYANVRYNDPNLRRLTNEERDDLEVVVKVKEGSSVFDAELWKQFNEIAKAAMENMSGNQIVILAIGLALAAVAPVLYKAWLKSRDKSRELQSRVDLSKLENERLQIFANALASQSKLHEANEDAQATNNRLIKAAKPEDQVEIRSVRLTGVEADKVAQTERESAVEVDLQGAFAILGNRTDKGDGFRIDVRRVSDGLALKAEVPMELATDQRELIQKAEWSKGVIELSIQARMLRGSVSQAIVYHAAVVPTASRAAND